MEDLKMEGEDPGVETTPGAPAPEKKESEQRFLATLGMTELVLNKARVESYGLSGVRTTIGGVVTW